MRLTTLITTSLLSLAASAIALDLHERSYPTAPSVTWIKCPPNPKYNLTSAVDCGIIKVPINHSEPSGSTIDLTLFRMKAKNGPAKLGNLYVNDGGPGAPTTGSIRLQDAYEQNGIKDYEQYSSELRANYDIIAMDIRGSGLSQPIYCDPAIFLEPYLFAPADNASFNQLAQRNYKLAQSCSNMTGPLFKLAGTDQVIQDFESLRIALGNSSFNYLGVSYGTQLGAQYIERYPHTLGRVVLDGNLDHSMSVPEAVLESASAVESTLEFFFRWCNTTTECRLYGQDQPAIWDDLLAKADQGTLLQSPEVQCNSTPCEAQSEQFIFVAQAQMTSGNGPEPYLFGGDFYALAEALDLANQGNTSFFENPSSPTSNSSADVSAYSLFATSCNDWRHTVRSAADMRSLYTVARAIAPRTRGISTKAYSTAVCVNWPFQTTNPERKIHFSDADAKCLPPVMLVGAFYDEDTAAAWSVQQRWMIPSAFNIWRNGGGHTSYHFLAETQQAMDAFLINGTIPEDGTVYMT